MKHNSIKFALFTALVIGLFLTFNQTINAQSALDGFDPNANGTVRAIVVQSNGKILVGGVFNGATYIIAVQSKRFVFTPQVVSVDDNVTDLDFVGQ